MKTFLKGFQTISTSIFNKFNGKRSATRPATRPASSGEPRRQVLQRLALEFCFLNNLSEMRILTTFTSLKTITDGSHLCL